MDKDYYRKVLEELLEEHNDIDEDNVCGYCGIVANMCNSCYGCAKNVCDDCDDKFFYGIYNSWYNGSYGVVICPNCRNTTSNVCECYSNDVLEYECKNCYNKD